MRVIASRERARISSRAIGAVLCLAFVLSGCTGGESQERSSEATVKVGVALPLSGAHVVDWETSLEWARDNVNAAGGVAGKDLELVYADLATEALPDVISRFARDPSIVGVIGPDSSRAAFNAAEALVQNNTVMVTPSATSADLFRAFSGYGLFWRTVESDIAQVRTLLEIAAHDGAETVSLVTSDEPYGQTFFDWLGFLAPNFGLDVTALVRYPQDANCRDHMNEGLSSNPDALVAVPTSSDVTRCMIEHWDQHGGDTRLLMPDAAESPSLMTELGPVADGVEGTALATGADSGFDAAFEERFGTAPPPYAANTYDALLLIAYGLQASEGEGGPALGEAMARVVDATGPEVGWDEAGVDAALDAIAGGRSPDVSGATGSLTFDRESHTDLVSSTYRHWSVADGSIETVALISTEESGTARRQRSAFHTSPGSRDTDDHARGARYQPGPKEGSWALLVAASSGWDNYRHQADVLAQYQLLRANGMADKRIILVLADDLAEDAANPNPGVLRYESGGPNMHRRVRVDYRLSEVDALGIMSILKGDESRRFPDVIDASRRDNVYVFIAGHGNAEGVHMGLQQAVPPPGDDSSVIDPVTLGRTIDEMSRDGGYRRLLIAVEACQAGVLGEHIDAPGALLITGAGPDENSLSANYDPEAKAWLADEFAFRLWHEMTEHASDSMRAVQEELYLSVRGSHVSTSGDRSNLGGYSLEEFISP